jgi:hypothetical protein
MDASEARTTGEKAYGPKGGARELFYLKDPEVLLAGPAGTGKSRAALEKLNFLALKYPGFRGLIVKDPGVTPAERPCHLRDRGARPLAGPLLLR